MLCDCLQQQEPGGRERAAAHERGAARPRHVLLDAAAARGRPARQGRAARAPGRALQARCVLGFVLHLSPRSLSDNVACYKQGVYWVLSYI